MIPDVVLMHITKFSDGRGFFLESYKKSEFETYNIFAEFVQDNHSFSSRGVLRGLHYQKNPQAQGKLIRVLNGEIFDVAVDIRKGSPYYGRWVGEFLSAQKLNMLYIPPGFAHGFCVTSQTADILYKSTSEYAPELERGILWNDPVINILWPITEPVLSARDQQLPTLEKADNNFVF